MQQHTHPAWLQSGATMPLALLSHGTTSTLTDASRIHQPQAAIRLPARFGRREGLPSGATQHAIRLKDKIVPRKTVAFEGQSYLGGRIARGRNCVLLRRWKGRSKLGGAHRLRLKLVPQLQAEVPDPLRDDLPGFLPAGSVRTPAIRVLFRVFIGQSILERTAMQVERDHIGRRESRLRHIGQEEFVDHSCTFDADTRLLLGGRMGRHHDPAALLCWPYSYVRAVVEGAHEVTFRAAELLIGRQM